MRKIFMTGARTPTVLELTRLLHQPDNKIYLADSVAYPPARYSRHAYKYFKVPKVAYEPHAFVKSILKIIMNNGIDLYIPTYEEIFTVALFKKELEDFCDVCCDTFEKLIPLHNKWLFSNLNKSFDIISPPTYYFDGSTLILVENY
jgi:intergrase/recombinase